MRTGVRLVLANCAELDRDREFNDWYDGYASSLTEPGYLVDAARYKDADAERDGRRPTYASLYGIMTPKPGDAWPKTRAWFEARGGHPLNSLLQVTFRGTYALLAGRASAVPKQSLAVVLADAQPQSEVQCELWYSTFAKLLAASTMGLEMAAFSIVEGTPNPALFLETYAFDDDDAKTAFDKLQSGLPARTRESRSQLLSLRYVGFFKRVFAHAAGAAPRKTAERGV
jgi:hypothetical protein